jgi:hypothetical protein
MRAAQRHGAGMARSITTTAAVAAAKAKAADRIGAHPPFFAQISVIS